MAAAYIGPPSDFNHDHQHLGTGPQTLLEIAEGRHPFCSALLSAKNPAIIVGAGLFECKDKDAIFSAVETIAKFGKVRRPDWNGLSVLLLNAAQAAALDLGLISNAIDGIQSAKFLYLMGADDVSLEKLPDDAFVVYQEHHGDQSVYRANVIFPSVAFSEKEGTYENTEGCSQWTIPAVPTVGDARDDWKIIRALSEVAGVRLPYDNLGAVRAHIRMVARGRGGGRWWPEVGKAVDGSRRGEAGDGGRREGADGGRRGEADGDLAGRDEVNFCLLRRRR